jgi:hypothetical protein
MNLVKKLILAHETRAGFLLHLMWKVLIVDGLTHSNATTQTRLPRLNVLL